ncbi:MAG: type II toxin-antitoxin system VapC family toxin [Leptolyngbyaceae cyanobacterium]
MIQPNKIYLDVCCLNRPFDDWIQPRIRLEAEAIVAILDRVQAGDWLLISSTALVVEIARAPDVSRRAQVMDLLAVAKIKLPMTTEHIQRAAHLQSLGFKPFDALHIACAEVANADVFMTTDDRLRRRAKTYANQLNTQVQNPLTWMIEAGTNLEDEDDDDPS